MTMSTRRKRKNQQHFQLLINPFGFRNKKQCNLSLIGVKYQFQKEFYALTDMPAEFQKAIHLTFTSYENIFTYLCDILIVTK